MVDLLSFFMSETSGKNTPINFSCQIFRIVFSYVDAKKKYAEKLISVFFPLVSLMKKDGKSTFLINNLVWVECIFFCMDI